MVASVEPRNDINHSWTLGESGWNQQMDENLLKLATFAGLSAIDRGLTTPPGSPTDGDTYIIPAGATGVWASRDNQIAIYRGPPTDAWEFYNPVDFRSRLLCYIEDEAVLSVWNGTNWTSGVSLGT